MESTTLQWLVQQFSAIKIWWVEKTDATFLEWQNDNELFASDIDENNNKIACVSGYFSDSYYENIMNKYKSALFEEIDIDIKGHKEKYKLLLYLKRTQFALKKQSKNYYQNYETNEFEMISHYNLSIPYDNTPKINYLRICSKYASIQYQSINELLEYLNYLLDLLVLIPEDKFAGLGIIDYTKSEIIVKEGIKLTDPSLKLKIEKLDIYQSALFFSYLKEAGLVLNYSKTETAKLCYYLTGHSDHNLEDNIFPALNLIKKDDLQYKNKKFKDIPLHNLNTVKEGILELLKLVEADIQHFEKKTDPLLSTQ